jgi:hypothetical protein
MAPRHKESADGGKNALPPLANNSPMLQRKSSSVSILDIGGNASSKTGDQKSNVFPKLERKSSSLQDVRASNGDKQVKRSKTQTKPRDKKQPKDGWSKTNTLPGVPKLSGSQGENKPTSANDRQAQTRRRRAGDIILTRPATIAVVVKYQRALKYCLPVPQVPSDMLCTEVGQHELKKFKACFRQIDLE